MSTGDYLAAKSEVVKNVGRNVVLRTPPVQIETVLKRTDDRDFVPLNSLTVRQPNGLTAFPLFTGDIGRLRLNHVQLIDRAIEALRDPRAERLEAASARLREAQDAVAAAQDEIARLSLT